MPDVTDERFEYRTTQMLKPATLRNLPLRTIQACPVRTRNTETTLREPGTNDRIVGLETVSEPGTIQKPMGTQGQNELEDL